MAQESYEQVATRKLMNGDTLEEYKFSNGLKVLLIPRHQAKVLTYQIWFRVGSVNEKLDPKLKKTGLAHLFEHMMFRGSKRYPDGKFDEITSRIGGERQNATTYFYRTNYYESIPSRNLEKLVELEADRMHELNLTKDLFEKEKGAVVGELRRHLDSPMALAWDELMKLAWEQAPYRYTVLGSEEEIKGFTLEEAQYFYKTYYAPNNATIIVAGDTTAEQLMPLLAKYYGDFKSQEVPHVPVPTEPAQKKERRLETTHAQATSETLILGYRVPPIDSNDTVPLSLLSTHLSKGMEARLRKVLVDTGIAVRASASTSNQPDLFEFFVSLAEGQTAEKALAIVDKEIKSLQTTALTKASFERALNQELLALYDDIMNNSELANWLGEFLMLSGNYMRGFEIIDGYKKLTPADLKRVAMTYLDKKSRSVVIVRPEKKSPAPKKGAAR